MPSIFYQIKRNYPLNNDFKCSFYSRLRGPGPTLTAWCWGASTWPALPATGARCPPRRRSSTPCPRARSSRSAKYNLLFSSLYLCIVLGCCPPRLWTQDLWSEKWSGLQAGRHYQVSISWADILMNILFVLMFFWYYAFDDNKQLV